MANIDNITTKISELRVCLTNLNSLATATTANMLDDSAGTLEDLQKKINDVCDKVESSISALESQNTILINNDDSRWYLKENGWNG